VKHSRPSANRALAKDFVHTLRVGRDLPPSLSFALERSFPRSLPNRNLRSAADDAKVFAHPDDLRGWRPPPRSVAGAPLGRVALNFSFVACLSLSIIRWCRAQRSAMSVGAVYYLEVRQSGDSPVRWAWEIRRHGIPMGVRLHGEGYQSRNAAEFAGQRELREFLTHLAQQERRQR
jgi:hypothetical protein